MQTYKELKYIYVFSDLTNPKTNTKTAGFTKEERDNFTELLDTGFVDSYRFFHPEKKNQYTFWSYRRNSRAENVGWYVLINEYAYGNKNVTLLSFRIFFIEGGKGGRLGSRFMRGKTAISHFTDKKLVISRNLMNSFLTL